MSRVYDCVWVALLIPNEWGKQAEEEEGRGDEGGGGAEQEVQLDGMRAKLNILTCLTAALEKKYIVCYNYYIECAIVYIADNMLISRLS